MYLLVFLLAAACRANTAIGGFEPAVTTEAPADVFSPSQFTTLTWILIGLVAGVPILLALLFAYLQRRYRNSFVNNNADYSDEQ